MSSLAKLRLCVEHFVEKPSGLRKERVYDRILCTEEVEKDEVFDCREFSW